jgi:hypothetical protein
MQVFTSIYFIFVFCFLNNTDEQHIILCQWNKAVLKKPHICPPTICNRKKSFFSQFFLRNMMVCCHEHWDPPTHQPTICNEIASFLTNLFQWYNRGNEGTYLHCYESLPPTISTLLLPSKWWGECFVSLLTFSQPRQRIHHHLTV